MIEGGKRELRRKQPWRRNTGAAPTTLPENAAAEVACEIARREREGGSGAAGVELRPAMVVYGRGEGRRKMREQEGQSGNFPVNGF